MTKMREFKRDVGKPHYRWSRSVQCWLLVGRRFERSDPRRTLQDYASGTV